MMKFQAGGKCWERHYTQEEYELDQKFIPIIEKKDRAWTEMNHLWNIRSHISEEEYDEQYKYWRKEHEDYCDKHKSITTERHILEARLDSVSVEKGECWQDVNRTYTNIERVYATRYDCMTERREAA